MLDHLTGPFGFKYHQNKKFDKDWHLQQLTTLGKHDNFIDQSIHELSGGERQIVSFCGRCNLTQQLPHLTRPRPPLVMRRHICS
ncbi:hypothetical protein DQF64_09015 [Moraxella bovis]|nr:hypothetical protein DQF64_09015 [Moraxella bovis]